MAPADSPAPDSVALFRSLTARNAWLLAAMEHLLDAGPWHANIVGGPQCGYDWCDARAQAEEAVRSCRDEIT